jgi:hypothetical protein
MVMMAELIDLTPKARTLNNLISSQPLEWRRGDWLTGCTLMCTREESSRFEAKRLEAYQVLGHKHIAFVPNHFKLDSGYHYTVMGLFRHRDDEATMRRVYYLAGLMECVTNASSPILRTDLLRRVYKSILEERERLGVMWRGNAAHFLLPLHTEYYNANLFYHHIVSAESLKDLYQKLQSEIDTQFDILAQHYVFYLPGTSIDKSLTQKGQ